MSAWTPWQIIGLVGVLGLVAVLFASLTMIYFARRRTALMALSPLERAARLFGEVVSRCDGAIPSETVDTLSAIFAAADTQQKLAMVTAMSGLLDRASDGPLNVEDLPEKLLAISRHFAGSSNASVR